MLYQVISEAESKSPLAACQGTKDLDLKTGGVNSPNYDGRTVYGYNLDCSWLINIPEGRDNQKLVLDFTHFHLDESTDCENDYVAIYEGAKLNKLIGKYCGRQAPPAIIFAADEKIRIEFHTDGDSGSEGPTGFAAKFHKAPKRLTDSGCRSSADQLSVPELEKLLVANKKFDECNFIIKPKSKTKTPQYPVIRLAPETDHSCCSAVMISKNKKGFDEKYLIDSSGLCRGEPVVGLTGIFNVNIASGVRDQKGRKCKMQLGFYSVADPNVPYLTGHTSSSVEIQSQESSMIDKSKYTCFMEEISYPRYLGKSEPIEPEEKLSSCRIEIRPKNTDNRGGGSLVDGRGAEKKPARNGKKPRGDRPNSQRQIDRQTSRKNNRQNNR
jgi:hypothetical protein